MVRLLGEGGADGEAGGDSACSSAELQLVGVLRRGMCSGAAAATGWEGRTCGARGRRSELGRVRFDPGHGRKKAAAGGKQHGAAARRSQVVSGPSTSRPFFRENGRH